MSRIHAVFVVIAFAFAMSAFAQTPDRVDAPVLSKGERWTYVTIDRWKKEKLSETVGVVAEADNKSVRIVWQNVKDGKLIGRHTETLSTTELNAIESGIVEGKAKTRYTPHDYTFDFPLEIGKTWKGTLILDVLNESRQVRREITAKVVGWEAVKTPAGTFNAFKIEKTGYYQRLDQLAPGWGGGTMKWTYWYAPDVKRSVRIEFEESSNRGVPRWVYTLTELMAYEPAKK
ncbi:MAG: hypothetical protein AAB355_01570 [Patescibacteria group bacterium]